MSETGYVRVSTTAEAVQHLARGNARAVAGGMAMIPAIRDGLVEPGRLVDISAIPDLKTISLTSGVLTIGATATHTDVEFSPVVAKAIPALCQVASGIGDPMVRNRATIGGSLAAADPGTEYPAVLVGLNATVVTTRRQIAAEAFFLDRFTTVLEADELITAITIPIPLRAGYAKLRQSASRYPLIGVLVALTPEGARVTVVGTGAIFFRAASLEERLSETFRPEVLDGLSARPQALTREDPSTVEYRTHLIGVLASRAAEDALAITKLS